MRPFRLAIAACLVGWATPSTASVEAVDDLGVTVRLGRPAERIVSFAPHVTELLFAVGAGPKVVGVVKHSDYPEAAKRIPEIGTGRSADLERIVALKADLIVAWLHASSMKQLDRLRSTGIPVFYSNPQTLAGIAYDGERLARLAGTESVGRAWREEYGKRVEALRTLYATRRPVRIFYQFWARPMYTLNREHYVSDLLKICGATNIFADLPVVAPVVSTESVVHANPEAIISARPLEELREQWAPWTQLQAVRHNNLFHVDPELTHRAGPRAVDAAEVLCRHIDEARARLSSRNPSERTLR